MIFIQQPVNSMLLLQKFRAGLIGSVLILFIGGGCQPTSDHATPETHEKAVTSSDAHGPMNCLILVLDAFHAAKSSSYGYPEETTPHIDEWAKNGILFEDALSQFTSTSPSAWSYMNGKYPYKSKRFFPNRPGDLPLAKLFQNAGYRSAGFSDNPFINGSLKMDEGFSNFEYYKYDKSNMNLVGAELSSPDPEDFERSRNEISELLFTRLEKWVLEDDKKPWFGYVHTLRPHNPYAPEEPWLSSFVDTDGLPEKEDLQEYFVAMEKEFFTTNFMQPEIIGREQIPLLHDLYLSNIVYTDHLVNELLTRLKSEGRLENTLVIIMSDHGEAFGEHGFVNHGGPPYRELTHVPFIVIPPAHMNLQPTRVTTPIELIDLLPTLVELFELVDTTEREGQSLVPLLKGESGYAKKNRFSQSRWQLTVQNETHKYMMSLNTEAPPKIRPPELFNISTDRMEETNLYGIDQAHEALRGEALDYLERQAKALVPKPPELTPDELDTLESLGYID